MFQAGALGQKRHQMAFDGVFHRREHLVVPPAGQQFYKLFHHNGVSSAMPGHGTVRYIQVHFFAVAEESCHTRWERSIFPSTQPWVPITLMVR